MSLFKLRKNKRYSYSGLQKRSAGNYVDFRSNYMIIKNTIQYIGEKLGLTLEKTEEAIIKDIHNYLNYPNSDKLGFSNLEPSKISMNDVRTLYDYAAFLMYDSSLKTIQLETPWFDENANCDPAVKKWLKEFDNNLPALFERQRYFQSSPIKIKSKFDEFRTTFSDDNSFRNKFRNAIVDYKKGTEKSVKNRLIFIFLILVTLILLFFLI